MRPISGGLLLQVADRIDAPGDDPTTWTLATGEPLDAAGLDDLVFAWRAVRAVKSNAILLATTGPRSASAWGRSTGSTRRGSPSRGPGSGPPGSVAASDAFFPFADGLQVLLDAGVRAVVQPGGSVRDEEVIAAAEAAGVTAVPDRHPALRPLMRGTRPHLAPPEAGDRWSRTRTSPGSTGDVAVLERVTFIDCRFDDAQLDELVTRRCVFERCVLTGVAMAGSRHEGSAFLSCRFDRAKLFDVVVDGCKLTGSQFPGADAAADDVGRSPTGATPRCAAPTCPALDLSGQRCREADLTDTDLRGVRPQPGRPAAAPAADHAAARRRPAGRRHGRGQLARASSSPACGSTWSRRCPSPARTAPSSTERRPAQPRAPG